MVAHANWTLTPGNDECSAVAAVGGTTLLVAVRRDSSTPALHPVMVTVEPELARPVRLAAGLFNAEFAEVRRARRDNEISLEAAAARLVMLWCC